MNAALSAWTKQIAGYVGGLLAFGFGAADLWHFMKLPQTTALVFVIGGLAVFGVTFAWQQGLNSAPVTPAAKSPSAQP